MAEEYIGHLKSVSKKKLSRHDMPEVATLSHAEYDPSKLVKQEKERGLLSAPENIQKHVSTRTKHLEMLLNHSHREQVQAANVMKDLTQKYGTRGKLPKTIFLRAFKDDLGKESNNDKKCGCGSENKNLDDKLDKEEEANRLSSFTIERPAAIVAQSSFVRHLLDVVQAELQRVGCPVPIFERDKGIEASRREYLKMNGDFQQGQFYNLQDIAQDQLKEDMIVETEDKMIARLKIYSRAFSAVILHFTALRPILLNIKRSYDSVLALKNQQMVRLRVVKRSIAYRERSMDEYMEDLRFECYGEMSEMEKRSHKLMRHIDKQDAAINTMADILNKIEITVGEEHELRRDSDDQKKMLIQDVNEYRKKLGMPLRTDEGAQAGLGTEEIIIIDDAAEEEDALSTEDPLILRKALVTCRKNLNESQNRLAILEAEYAEVIPRHLFESLKLEMAELEKKYEGLVETYNILLSQVQGLKDQIEKLITDREDHQVTIEGLRGKATPRPSWIKVGEYLEGGVPYWLKATEGKSSAVIKDKLIEELTAKKISGPPDYLTALGSNAKAKFLRYDNRVRDRHLPRRDAAMIIQDIWQVRVEHIEQIRKSKEVTEDENGVLSSDSTDEGPPLLPFGDYLANYFVERYNLPSLRMEWSYNLVDACQRFSTDQRLSQFLYITNETYDECVYHQFRKEIMRLQNYLLRKSDEENQPPGSLQRPLFAQVLKELFPAKTEENLALLLKAASKQAGAHSDWSIINYNGFFVISDEGIVGTFIDELARQYDIDRNNYAHEIIAELASQIAVPIQNAESESDPSGDREISMQQFYKAIVAVDPLITEEKIAAALAWVFAGVSTLPGQEAKGKLLLNYVKSKALGRIVSEDPSSENFTAETEDEEFERAMKSIMADNQAEDEEAHQTSQQKRQKIKKMKVTTLRNIVKRLKGAAFLRSGEKNLEVIYDSKDKSAEDKLLLDGDIARSPSEDMLEVAEDA